MCIYSTRFRESMAGEEMISTGTIQVGKKESFWPCLFSRAGSVGVPGEIPRGFYLSPHF